ncbi:TPA_asm: RNA-directed RNA polymerase [ssRNA phage SRR6960799_40]|uniref:RNA-directed RNA polymerase n=1 Tax=ssRNA phage SRR6960799_40 TaxID=2786599 RepID=A0A8S5L0M9_9VIRU|nr:RNA-directed RNA polymerase [ssRNA phage SRR6960799_40]DAD50682.1 TPA_asm: RNA-directed RNA polymerase [ssRNA phage SRR6960799_40]
MTNSYDSYVLGLYNGILKDIEVQFPRLQKDLWRDFSRLSSCVETRGLSFLMIDLVDFGKHFDKCLANQRLTLSGLPFQRAYKKGTVVPRLFKGLLLRVFTSNGELRSDCDVQAVRALRQLYYMVKKFRITCSDERNLTVVRSFYAIEAELRRGSHNWDVDEPNWGGNKASLEDFALPAQGGSQLDLFQDQVEEPDQSISCDLLSTIQKVADIISAEIGVLHPLDWRAKHGPGVVSDLKRGLSKYSFPYWPEKLERIFPYADFAFANYGLWSDVVARQKRPQFDTEPPSRLILVPKTLKAPRLIAAEPTAHQWCQQVVKDFLSQRVLSSWIGKFINFVDQRPNQELALQGSLDGSLSTIDLSEASDRVSTYLVERVFRRNHSLLDALHATRTRSVRNMTSYGLDSSTMLRKFSCMGSACTFPVQSIVFLAIALGTTLYERRTKVSIKNIRRLAGSVRTFGDDIIVPTDVAERVAAALSLLGLRVNPSKTFWSGNFRESCGLDAFRGNDVTPTYIMSLPQRSKPESISSVVSSHNNYLAKGWLQAAAYLEQTVRKECKSILSVSMDSGIFGLQTYDIPNNQRLKRRWNTRLHRLEYRSICVQTQSIRTRDQGESMILQYFTERPRPSDAWVAGVSSIPRIKLSPRWVYLG